MMRAAYHELLQDTVEQNRNVMCAIDARSLYVFRGKRNFRSRFLRDVIANHRSETVEVGDLAKVDLLSSSHALAKCGLFANVEMTMQSFMAFYEDAAKTEAAARKEGYDGINGSLMDYVEPHNYCTAKKFAEITQAEAWLIERINAMQTVFGAGTIRKLEQVSRRCRYCTCRGVKVVHEYTVEDTGIVEDEALEDECLN